MNSLQVPPQPLDTLQWVTVRLHSNGTISTSGTIADKKMALHLLEQARDAIKRQIPEYRAIVIPGSEVQIAPVLPVKDLGYVPAHERGDP
jgi:hypothetical protein